MRLPAVGDFTFWPLCTVLRRMTALEAVETQPLRCQALNTFLDVGVDKDVAHLRRVPSPVNPADVVDLLLQR